MNICSSNTSSDSLAAKFNSKTAALRHRRSLQKKGGVMHKVRSMESVTFNGLEFKGTWTQPSSRDRRTTHHEKASRFSGYALSQRTSLPTTPESNMLREIPSYSKLSSSEFLNNNLTMYQSPSNHQLHRSLSRPSSVASLTGLVDMPEPDEGMSEPILTLMDMLKGTSVRSGSLLHLIVLSLLLFVTLNDVVSKATTRSIKPFSQYKNDRSEDVLSSYPSYSDRNNSSENNMTGNRSKKKGLLGPAMIETVTEALSPILPFAGGVDLRRDENWKSWNSWLSLWDFDKKETTMDDFPATDPVMSVPRGGDQIRGNTSSKNRNLIFKTKQTLSNTEPFFPLKGIEQMTLHEMVSLFDYAASPNVEVSVFLKQKFPDHVNIDLLKRAIEALDDATAKSRGKGVVPAVIAHDRDVTGNGPLSSRNGYGDIDALKFCAVMRILAEWRVLRQVPPGYKGYSVGMNLGHKDIVQNIVKIESAIHKWIEEKAELEALKRADGDSNIEPRSPTLREILQYEIDMDVHPNNRLPRLKDKTAAMGLLWVRRQLQYQTAIFRNIIDVPDVYPTTITAVTAAYAEVYGNLHGWTVQKIFNYSFQSAPDADLIYRHMNPIKLEQVLNSAKSGIVPPSNSGKKHNKQNLDVEKENFDTNGETAEPEETLMKSINTDDDRNLENLKGENHFVNFFTNIGNEWDKFTKNFVDECDKIGKNISKIFSNDEEDKVIPVTSARLDQRGGANADNANRMSDDELETYISKEMAADARNHILAYLGVIGPILNDLSGLFDEMNMDDPTKV